MPASDDSNTRELPVSNSTDAPVAVTSSSHLQAALWTINTTRAPPPPPEPDSIDLTADSPPRPAEPRLASNPSLNPSKRPHPPVSTSAEPQLSSAGSAINGLLLDAARHQASSSYADRPTSERILSGSSRLPPSVAKPHQGQPQRTKTYVSLRQFGQEASFDPATARSDLTADPSSNGRSSVFLQQRVRRHVGTSASPPGPKAWRDQTLATEQHLHPSSRSSGTWHEPDVDPSLRPSQPQPQNVQYLPPGSNQFYPKPLPPHEYRYGPALVQTPHQPIASGPSAPFIPHSSLLQSNAPPQPRVSDSLWPDEEDTESAVAKEHQGYSSRPADSPLIEMRRAVFITPSDPSNRMAPAQNGNGSGFGSGSGARGGPGGFRGVGGRGQRRSMGAAGGGGTMVNDFYGDDDDGGTAQQPSDARRSQQNRNGHGNARRGPAMPGRLFNDAMSAASSTGNKASKGKSTREPNGEFSPDPAARWAMPSDPFVRYFRTVIQQDYEQTRVEQATKLVEATINRNNPHFRVHDADGRQHATLEIKGKGKGKGKASAEAITLDDSDTDEIDDADDDFDDGPRPDAPGGSRRIAAKVAKESKQHPRTDEVRHQHNGETLSSDDISIMPPRAPGYRTSGEAKGTTVPPQGNTERLRQEYEKRVELEPRAEPKRKAATSLAPRGMPAGPRRDGSGNDGTDEYKSAPTTSTKRTRAEGSKPHLGGPIKVKVRSYMVGMKCVDESRLDHAHYLVLNTSGKPKLSLQVQGGPQGLEDIASFTAADVSQLEYTTGTTEYNGTVSGPLLWFRFRNEQVYKQLIGDWAIEEDLDKEPTLLTTIDVNHEKLSPGSDTIEHFLAGIRDFKGKGGSTPLKIQEIVQGKTKPLLGLFQNAFERAQGVLSRRRKEKAPRASRAAAPRDTKPSAQQSLTFYHGKDSNLSKDSQGDYVHTGPSNSIHELEQPQAPRRSTRASTSTYKAVRAAAPAVNEPPADQVMLEYPNNEPGSVTLTWGDRKRLNEDEFLNDTLIEFGLKKAIHKVKESDARKQEQDRIAPAVHVFNSFFYKKLSTTKRHMTAEEKAKADPYYLVQKWTKKINLFDKKYIIVPINEHLHWYLAIIVNPRWIIDNAEGNRPPEPKSKATPVAVTRNRASRDTTVEDTTANDATEQTAVPAGGAEAADPAEPVEMRSRFFSKKSPSTAEGDADMVDAEVAEEAESESGPREEEIQSKIRAELAKTEMGGEDVADEDVEMIDPSVEGGGPSRSESGKDGYKREADIVLDDERGVFVAPESQAEPSIAAGADPLDVAATSQPSTAEAPAAPPVRVAIPFEFEKPTRPPKGGSSPVAPAPELPAEPEPVSIDPTLSAEELAERLGADASATDRCWIFTFDSLGSDHGAAVTKLRNYLDMEAKTKMGLQWTAAHLVQGIAVTVPQQTNFCDCGLYILHFVETFLANPDAMISWIVSRHPLTKEPSTKGRPAQEVKRERAARKQMKERLKSRIEEENAWHQDEAMGKRRAMRAEVDTLIEEYKPIKAKKDQLRAEKDAEERERREQRRREREERTALEAVRRADEFDAADEAERKEAELRPAEEAAEARTKAAPKGKGRGKKKKLDEIVLSSDDDDDSMYGSPRTAPTSFDSRPPEQPAPPGRAPPVVQRAEPRAAPPATRLHPVVESLVPSQQTLSTAAERVFADADETMGDLDNSQVPDPPSTARVLPLPPSAQAKAQPSHAPRSRDADESEPTSPPPRKKIKTVRARRISQSPEPVSRPDETVQVESSRPTGGAIAGPQPPAPAASQEELDPLDSSIEVRQPVSPELVAPPPNQEQQHGEPSRRSEASPSRKPDSSTSSTGSKKKSAGVSPEEGGIGSPKRTKTVEKSSAEVLTLD
ncbi:hypothetical protein JCM10212_003882 [Sporobolomyces blumeae]